jgi:negative regulator of sigma-B (phosphoserine phosphatase)
MSSSGCASVARAAAEHAAPPWLEWAVAGRPRHGEEVSGDAAIVELGGGAAVVAAVDGLGHGAAASIASRRAVDALRGGSGVDVDELLRRCHAAIHGTRGAAIGIASIVGEALSWAGVGNVEGWIFGGAGAGRERPLGLLLRPGVVGASLPPAHPTHETLRRGDVLILVSDGISTRFVDGFDPVGSPQDIADTILREHARQSDDAVVVVARYLGARA